MSVEGARGTPVQRLRAGLVAALAAILERLPARAVDAGADAVGELWYRVAPGRAAVARGNLAHIAAWLAANGRGSRRVRAAATDGGELERLVRGAFRHAARTYAETLRGAAGARDVRRRLILDDPARIDAVFGDPAPKVFVTMHYGSLSGIAAALVYRSAVPITAPMETLPDPELQRLLHRLRGGTGTRIIPLAGARHGLRAALKRGEAVGLVADRDILGGGIRVPLFGLPAPLPMGPAFLALEFGVPLHVTTLRRASDGYRCRMVSVPHPPAGGSRRARVESLLAAVARTFEDFVAAAPEQWGAVMFPIWDAVGPRQRAAPLRGSPAADDGAAPP